MSKLLITGGAGFIGSNFVRHWRRTHTADRLVVLDALTYAGHYASIEDVVDGEGVIFVRGDIRDEEHSYELLRRHDIDVIVHFAAESHVDRSISGPDAFVDTNINGTHALLKAARRAWLLEGGGVDHRFHHISTDEVYGSLGPADPAFHELTRYAPNSPYAASKAASDFLVRAYHHTYGMRTAITNCSNNFGPYQFPEKLIPLFILNCLHGRPLPIYGDGLNVRDWLYVEDHCRAIDQVIHGAAAGSTYNVGGENELPNLTLIDAICALVDAAFQKRPVLREKYPRSPCAGGASAAELKTFVQDRPGHDRRYAIDMSRLKQELGFSLSVNWRQGLAATIDWYVDHDDWWRPLTERAIR